MGCPCELRFHADTKQTFARAARKCVAEIRRFERKFSRYRPDSVTSAINRAAGAAPVSIDAETAAILEYATVCHEQSGGLFDMTSGVFRRVWHPKRTALPSQPELDDCLTLVGWEKVEHSERHAYLPIRGMELDFGGVVKEYAADAAAIIARQVGIRHGLINLGGDICVVGPQPGGDPWPVGIVHPVNSESALATVSLTDGALTTSGSYERFVEIEGARYSHLIDPSTGWPVQGLLSVSVAAPQALVAGSVASIALLQPPIDGLNWLDQCATPFLAFDTQLNSYGHFLAE